LNGGATKIIFCRDTPCGYPEKSSSKYLAKKIHHIECPTKITSHFKKGKTFSNIIFQDL